MYDLHNNYVINSISEAAGGCKMGAYSTNFSTLQRFLEKTCNGLRAHCLKINFYKFKYIVFKKKLKIDTMDEIEVDRCAIKRVEQIQYQDINLMDNSSIPSNVDRCCDSFLRKFNEM